MEETLKNIKKIKIWAREKVILNIIFPIFIIIFPLFSSRKFDSWTTPVVFLIGFILMNLVFSIRLIIFSSSIYISSKYNTEEVTEEIKTFKSFFLVCSILSIFFGLKMSIVLWIIANKKINFLEEKIKEQTETITEEKIRFLMQKNKDLKKQ